MTTCHRRNANFLEHIFVLRFRIKARSRPISPAFALGFHQKRFLQVCASRRAFGWLRPIYALGRLARRWTPGEQEEWSLVLSVYPDGNENAHDPRVLITPLDSKKAFIRFRQEWVPKDGRQSARHLQGQIS